MLIYYGSSDNEQEMDLLSLIGRSWGELRDSVFDNLIGNDLESLILGMALDWFGDSDE